MVDGDGNRRNGEITYRPKWEGPFEAWSRKFVAANLWRVSALVEYEDAVQECAVVFSRCCKYYIGTVDNPAWFMALYIRSVNNTFHMLASKNRRLLEVRQVVGDLHQSHRVDIELSNGPVLAALSHASEELRQVLRVIAIAPQELLALMLGYSPSHEKEWSRSLCRLARTDRVRSDLITELRNLLL